MKFLKEACKFVGLLILVIVGVALLDLAAAFMMGV